MNEAMIEQITHNNKILAIIIRHDYSNQGITFFTPDDFSQQLAYMNHHKGHVIQPHVHNIVRREVLYTKEVLVIKKGRVKTDFYTDDQEYIRSSILETGDILLLASGGHGFEMLEDTEMYEIKQGPYAGENDKIRFEPKKKENEQ
ncbi:hypothetical protein FACS189479_07320 [Spirochaetia bacterium]|nr:hypothetical protein FACS189479_07320 [Spirochaetia bacterium]